VIITIIVYTYTWLIVVGYIESVLLAEIIEIKLGMRPVAESLTTETETISPASMSVIEGN
jgi:hypothetical protein